MNNHSTSFRGSRARALFTTLRHPLALAGLLLAGLGAGSSRAEILYVGNAGNNTIARIPSSGVTANFTGTNVSGARGLAFDSAGNLYVANIVNSTIERYTPTGTATLFASTGLNVPTGLAFDLAGNLYAANVGDNTITKFTPGGVPSLFANTGLNQPYGLAFDGGGNLFVGNASSASNTIQKFTPGGVGSVFATGLNAPFGLAFDSTGVLFVSNGGDNTIRKFSATGVPLGNFAINGGNGGTSILSSPFGIAFDLAGNLYAGNSTNNTIEKFTPAGQGSVFANTGLNTPEYIAFTTNAGVPLLLPPTPEPTTLALAAMGSLALLTRQTRRRRN